ncbi:MAG TPA: protein kinase, partial [Ktedonobacteraceae bacterium]|nr:protein kinase [Ktedonobacteraceae bacterium]
MQGKFHQYNLRTTLAKKHSHVTYLASPTNDPELQVVLTVFASSPFPIPHERENLLQKARHIKELQHPHLAPILNMGIEEEQPFVVREYLPNDSLRSRMKQISPRRLELADALTIVSQVGKALAYMHEHNIVHGNIKPENILFDANGQILLTDFYLFARTDAIIRDQLAEEYAFCYLAPEQFTGICDARSDQYALGCLTYELITGRVPFAAQSLASMMGQASNTLPVPLSESVADLPPTLEVAILKTLAKDPNERFFDFSLFLEVIQSVLSPTPPFPLLISTTSRKKGTTSHSVMSTKAETISSPIRRRASKRVAPQQPEPSGASSSTKGNRAEPAVPLSTPDANMPKQVATIPNPELLELPSGVELFVSLTPDSTNPLIERADKAAKQPLQFQNRKRLLGLALLLSMIVALLAYEFWPFELARPDKSLHSVQEMTNGMTTQIPTSGTDIPTRQSSAQATINPVVQATTQPTVPSPLQRTTQETTPTPSQGSTTTINMFISFYGWTDNGPAGASIAYPKLHSSAGGGGTYSDPITFGTSSTELSPGTIIYVQYLKKYFIMEDECSECGTAWKNHHSYEIVLWIGGDANSSSDAIQNC